MNKFLKYTLFASAWFLVIGLLSFVNRSNEPTEKTVEITTKYGVMKLKLYNETPLHRDNFLKLVSQQYYDSLLFHRVINLFMIQGGDPDSKNAAAGAELGNGGPDYEIPAEFVTGLYHKKGALAAAREGDPINPEKKSSGSQFYIVQGQVFDTLQLKSLENRCMQQNGPDEFKKCLSEPDNKELLDKYMKATQEDDKVTVSEVINLLMPIVEERLARCKFTEEQIQIYTTVGGTPHLDNNYTVFGEMISGWDVLDSIAAVKGDKNNRPLEDIVMSIRVVDK